MNWHEFSKAVALEYRDMTESESVKEVIAEEYGVWERLEVDGLEWYGHKLIIRLKQRKD